jgi:hypothetical protein
LKEQSLEKANAEEHEVRLKQELEKLTRTDAGKFISFTALTDDADRV